MSSARAVDGEMTSDLKVTVTAGAPINRDITLIAVRRSRLGQSGGGLSLCARESLELTDPLRLRLRRRNAPHLTGRETTATDRLRLAPRSGRNGVDGRSPERLRGDGGKWIAERGAVGA